MSSKPKLSLVKGGKASESEARKLRNTAASYHEERKRREKERLEDIEKNGGAAEKCLLKYRRQRIPTSDRRRMAVNMDALLTKHDIGPADLPWQKDYKFPKQFYNALGRCRLKSLSTAKERLNAYPRVWLQIIGYVFEALQVRHDSTSRQALVEQLVWGTKFHPMKQRLTQEDLLLSALNAVGDSVAKENALMAHYRESARLRAVYYRTHGRLMSHMPFIDFGPSFFRITLGELHCAHAWGRLPDKRFIDLTSQEWDRLRPLLEVNQPKGELFLFPWLNEYMEWHLGRADLQGGSCFPEEDKERAKAELSLHIIETLDLRNTEALEDSITTRLCDLSDADWENLESRSEHFRFSYQYLRYCIEGWNGLRSEARSIDAFVHSTDFPIEAVREFPRAFLGIFNYALPDSDSPDVDELDNPWSAFTSTGFSAAMAEQLLSDESKTDDEALAELVYLVLIPNFERNQLVPHLCFCYDGSSVQEVTLRSLVDGELSILPPFDADEDLTVKPVREIVLDDIDRVIEEIKETAALVTHNDPYKTAQKTRIDKLTRIVSDFWVGEHE